MYQCILVTNSILKVEISFKKREGKKNIISYQRAGLPDYWLEADDFLILHDLSHYAIETQLGYQSAFWGLIKSGVNPSIFENKEARDQILISNEAWYAESLANLFVIELTQGAFDNFNLVFQESVNQMNKNIPDFYLSVDQINGIRNYYQQLAEAWKALASEQELILHF